MNTASQTTPPRLAPYRRCALIICAAGMLLNFAGASRAQPANDGTTQPPPAPAMDERFDAPIGHRQPMASDLPQNVLHEEGTTGQNERDIDKKLNICRGC